MTGGALAFTQKYYPSITLLFRQGIFLAIRPAVQRGVICLKRSLKCSQRQTYISLIGKLVENGLKALAVIGTAL